MKDTDSVVVLEGNLSIRNAAELRTQLLAAVPESRTCTIDAGGLTGADVGILQLLVSAKKAADAAGTLITLRAPADGVLARLLVDAGFVGRDGAARTPEGDFWINA